MTWLKLRNRKTEEPKIVATDGPVKRVRPIRHVRATIQLPPGVGVKDLTKTAAGSNPKDLIEAAAGWPPGSMVITPNMDNAGIADVILTDPRILRKPVPWEGPSWINGSVADPISIGLYQDGTECEVEVPATQIQIMGQVGSGKSLGGAWNALAELITREDVVIWGIDIKKGMQTLGPLSKGLHRIATTPAEAIDILRDANNLITPRTNYLSSEGLGKWFRGCGIKYLVVWIEEVPEVMNELGTKGTNLWVKSVRAARSAGITMAWSLQRADATQIPTITRGQATKWCFGVQDIKEANFGLSKIQKSMGCQPEVWGQRRPGMSYIDAPNIMESKVAMPLRAWWFGKDDSILRHHSAQFPWENRPYDDLMIEYFAAKERGEVVVDMAPEPQDTPPSERSEPTDSKPAMTSKQRGAIGRKMLREQLKNRQGQRVAARDFVDLTKTLGLDRSWIDVQLKVFVMEGWVKKHKEGNAVTWEILPDATD